MAASQRVVTRKTCVNGGKEIATASDWYTRFSSAPKLVTIHRLSHSSLCVRHVGVFSCLSRSFVFGGLLVRLGELFAQLGDLRLERTLPVLQPLAPFVLVLDELRRCFLQVFAWRHPISSSPRHILRLGHPYPILTILCDFHDSPYILFLRV